MKLLPLFILISINCAAQTNMLTPDGYKLKNAGLSNIAQLDSTIIVHLMYAYDDNFMGKSMYRTLREAFLQPEAADKLIKAQKKLKETYPQYTLIVYDAARPQWAQEIMWNFVKDTPMRRYVASPGRVSMHTYGVAVDISILDENGKELNMGTPVDFLGALAEPRNEPDFLASGELTKEHIKNRQLLRSVMRYAGFTGIPNEWWHFEAIPRAEAQTKYKPL